MMNNKENYFYSNPSDEPMTFSQHAPTDTNASFNLADGTEMLRLDEQGFHYKGQVIEDAGEAYKLFREWLEKVRTA